MDETVKNLMKAFIGESMARNRYTMYAKTAKKEGYEKVMEIFELTAFNETEHAKWLFRMINDIKKQHPEYNINDIEVPAEGPTVLGTTIENIKSAINGENHEHTVMYPEFADIAEKEGYPDIAKRLRAIGKAEVHHEERYKKILAELEGNSMFKKDKTVKWFCRKCGYPHEGPEPPEECPSCGHPKNYFELECEIF